MAALSDNIEIQEKEGKVIDSPMAVDIIYRGGLLKINAAGYLAPCSSESGAFFAGISQEEVDNSGGSAGDLDCKSLNQGLFLLTGSGFAQSNIGDSVYASDDQTVSLTDSGNLQLVGRIEKYVSSTKVWVQIQGMGSDAILSTGDGLKNLPVAIATYDFAEHGGAISSIGLGVTIPDNAIITKAYLEIITAFVSSGGAGTIAVNTEGAGDILAAVDADTLSGINAGIPVGTTATMIKLSADRVVTLTIAGEVMTQGKCLIFVEYVLSL